MTVYVTVETFQGALQEARAYLTEASALKAEQNWLREIGIICPCGLMRSGLHKKCQPGFRNIIKIPCRDQEV